VQIDALHACCRFLRGRSRRCDWLHSYNPDSGHRLRGQLHACGHVRADMHSLAGRIVDRRPTIEWEPP
jgi:hypothetical protein